MNYSEIDNLVFEDIDHNDHPDYCDAFVSSANINGRPMTEEEIEVLQRFMKVLHIYVIIS